MCFSAHLSSIGGPCHMGGNVGGWWARGSEGCCRRGTEPCHPGLCTVGSFTQRWCLSASSYTHRCPREAALPRLQTDPSASLQIAEEDGTAGTHSRKSLLGL